MAPLLSTRVFPTIGRARRVAGRMQRVASRMVWSEGLMFGCFSRVCLSDWHCWVVGGGVAFKLP